MQKDLDEMIKKLPTWEKMQLIIDILEYKGIIKKTGKIFNFEEGQIDELIDVDWEKYDKFMKEVIEIEKTL